MNIYLLSRFYSWSIIFWSYLSNIWSHIYPIIRYNSYLTRKSYFSAVELNHLPNFAWRLDSYRDLRVSLSYQVYCFFDIFTISLKDLCWTDSLTRRLRVHTGWLPALDVYFMVWLKNLIAKEIKVPKGYPLRNVL